MEDISFLYAFGYGLLAFVSPCVLPLVPVFLASLAGSDAFDGKRNRMTLFLHSLSFVLGFMIMFTLWGAGAGLIGSALVDYSTQLRHIVGALLMVFGIIMLAALRLRWLNFEKRLTPAPGRKISYLRSFLIGLVFPLAWVPCTSWVLGGILALAGTSQTAWRGAFLLATYSLGLGLPFLAIGIAFDFLLPTLKKIGRYSGWFYIGAAVMLITAGILLILK